MGFWPLTNASPLPSLSSTDSSPHVASLTPYTSHTVPPTFFLSTWLRAAPCPALPCRSMPRRTASCFASFCRVLYVPCAVCAMLCAVLCAVLCALSPLLCCAVFALPCAVRGPGGPDAGRDGPRAPLRRRAQAVWTAHRALPAHAGYGRVGRFASESNLNQGPSVVFA